MISKGSSLLKSWLLLVRRIRNCDGERLRDSALQRYNAEWPQVFSPLPTENELLTNHSSGSLIHLSCAECFTMFSNNICFYVTPTTLRRRAQYFNWGSVVLCRLENKELCLNRMFTTYFYWDLVPRLGCDGLSLKLQSGWGKNRTGFSGTFRSTEK